MKRIFILAVMLLAMFFDSSVLAADFEKELAKALTNIPPDASNASMGNAWVATPDFASNSAAVTAMGIFENGGVSLNYGFIDFDKGPDVQFWSPSATVRLPVGVLQFSYTEGYSGRKTFQEQFSEEGGSTLDIEFDSIKELDFQYGFQAGEKIFLKGDRLYFGVGYNYGKSDVTFHEHVVELPHIDANFLSKNKSRSHTWSVGAAYQPNPSVTLGAYYAHSWDKDKEEIKYPWYDNFVSRESDESQSNQYRLGIGAQVTPTTFVAADYQHLDLPSGNSDQLFAGIEQAILADWLYLYAGWAGDGPTGGIGAYFENGGINLAYMHDTNDGLDDTLGNTKIVMIAGYWNF